MSDYLDAESGIEDYALVLVRLGSEDGGRVDPARILARRPGSTSREAFLAAQDHGWLDGEGWVTPAGCAALADPAGGGENPDG